MIFNHIQKCAHKLCILYGNDVVKILLDIRENFRAGRLYCGAVCNRVDRRKRRHLTVFDGFLHTVCICRLYADHLDLRI